MIVEELFLPWYSPVSNAISDLGGHHAGSYAVIFDASVIVVGLCAFTGAVLLRTLLPPRRSLRWGTVCLMLTGLGAIGVGCFPEYTGAIHGIMASVAFIFGGIGLLLFGHGGRKVGEEGYFPWLTTVCGIVDLLSLVGFLLLENTWVAGAVERMIVAPVLLWAFLVGVRMVRTGEPVHVPTGANRPFS